MSRDQELAELNEEQEKAAKKLRKQFLEDLGVVLENRDGIARLEAISDEEWAAAEAADAEGANLGVEG